MSEDKSNNQEMEQQHLGQQPKQQHHQSHVDSIIEGIQSTLEERFERIEEITAELEMGEATLLTLHKNTPSTNEILDLRREIIDMQCVINDLEIQISTELTLQSNLKQQKELACLEILKGKEQFLTLSNEIVRQMNVLINHEMNCLEVYNKNKERYLMADEDLAAYYVHIANLRYESNNAKKDHRTERTKKLIKAIGAEVAEKKKRLEALGNELNFLNV